MCVCEDVSREGEMDGGTMVRMRICITGYGQGVAVELKSKVFLWIRVIVKV